MYICLEMDDELVEELFSSATSGDLTRIQEFARLRMIQVESLVNSQKQTLLHIAAGYGRSKLAIYLISKGANVNSIDIEGQSPLHNACCHGHYTTSRKLIEAGADVNLTDNQGWSPLHFAVARKGNAEKISQIYWNVIELLLDYGADPYLKSLSGRNCIDRIKDGEARRLIRQKYLLNLLNDTDLPDEDREPIIDKYMSIKDFFKIVKVGDDELETLRRFVTPNLLQSRLRNCDNITPLHRAAGYNHLETAQLFIRSGAKVNATDNLGRIPLHNAAQYGHVEMIELLISERSDINKQDLIGYTPLHVAASNRTFTACLKLIELGAKINSKCLVGKIPYDLAECDDVREVLKPDSLRHRLEVVPSTFDEAVYIDIQVEGTQFEQNTVHYSSHNDNLMLDSSSSERLFRNTQHTIKKIMLNENDPRYQMIEKRMSETIMNHTSDSGGNYSDYDIISIEHIRHEKVWSKYRLMCQRLEIEYGVGTKNEKLLFHGSNFIDNIQSSGFDERYAQRNGMFGAGIYFAKHSSKSNQYVFGWGQGCQEHTDKSCYKCERKMIYAQVALGRSLISKEAMPDCAHAPPGYSSVTGLPESTENLIYPEYVIYSGDQAYPSYVITYRIKP